MTIASQQWYALFVRSRHEFVTRDELRKKNIDAFLPAVEKPRRWKDRTKLVTFPLFPGYLFVNLRPHAELFLSAVQTRGAVSFISMEPGHPAVVDAQEIQTLKGMIESGEELDLFPHLLEGQKVRVRRGSLRGAEGTLARKGDRSLFVVNIELLGRSIGMKIQADDLEQA